MRHAASAVADAMNSLSGHGRRHPSQPLGAPRSGCAQIGTRTRHRPRILRTFIREPQGSRRRLRPRDGPTSTRPGRAHCRQHRAADDPDLGRIQMLRLPREFGDRQRHREADPALDRTREFHLSRHDADRRVPECRVLRGPLRIRDREGDDNAGIAPSLRATIVRSAVFQRRKRRSIRRNERIVAIRSVDQERRSGTSIRRMNARISTLHPVNSNKRMLRWHYDATS